MKQADEEWRSKWFNSHSWHLVQRRFREWDSSMADCLCNFKIKDTQNEAHQIRTDQIQ